MTIASVTDTRWCSCSLPGYSNFNVGVADLGSPMISAKELREERKARHDRIQEIDRLLAAMEGAGVEEADPYRIRIYEAIKAFKSDENDFVKAGKLTEILRDQ